MDSLSREMYLFTENLMLYWYFLFHNEINASCPHDAESGSMTCHSTKTFNVNSVIIQKFELIILKVCDLCYIFSLHKIKELVLNTYHLCCVYYQLYP